MQSESMQFDVVIVGASAAGLAAAIRLKQLAAQKDTDVSVCVLDKQSVVGEGIVHGAVMNPDILDELLPNATALGAPLSVPVTEDRLLFLTATKAYQTHSWMVPARLRNDGNCIVSLGSLLRWLAHQAQHLGVAMFSGVAAADVLYGEDGSVKGVATGADHPGQAAGSYPCGMAWHAKYTLFSEGASGLLGEQLVARYGGNHKCDAQANAIGIKEVWEFDSRVHQSGLVVHTIGWPQRSDAHGSAALYYLDHNRLAVDYVACPAHQGSYCLPYDEFKRYKNHPAIRTFFEGGRCLSYHARTLAAETMPVLPKLIFHGGALLEDDDGFLKPSHARGGRTTIPGGLRMADAAFAALAQRRHTHMDALPIFDQETNHAA